MARTPGRSLTRRLLTRCRDWPVAWRCAVSAALVVGPAALAGAGLAATPDGQPFPPILGILVSAVLFGRGVAVFAAVVATAAGALLLLPASGPVGDGPLRTALSLVGFLVVALGTGAAVESTRRMAALMTVADARRRADRR